MRTAYCEKQKRGFSELPFMIFTLCVAFIRRGPTRNLI